MLTPGQKLFEYEIIRTLGQGGFATVFEAQDRVLNRRVAIKQLLTNKATNDSAVKRFIQEGRVAVALQHPNVISIYGFRIQDKKFYMIMEYLPGGSLENLLEKKGKLPIEQAVNLTLGICEGLAKFHEHGILHRDIKAENILLTADGDPKVIDFGIAHVPEAAGGMALTQAGFQPSTVLYSSPEQVRGEPLDARSDVYQIGELLYYMLMGEHYINFDRLEAQAMAHGGANQFRAQSKLYELLEEAICEEIPDGLRILWREVGALARVVETALAKDKTHRFKDAAEFAATLKVLSINTTPATSESENLALLDAVTYHKRGQAHASTRNYEQAIMDYTQAIALDPNYAEAYDSRGLAHLLMENYGQALLDCSRAIELAPDFVTTHVNRGIAYTGLRDYDRATIDYDTALKLSPKNIYAYYNHGNVQLWLGQNAKAIPYYNQVIELEPTFVAAYLNRGVAYTELKQYPQALADFSRAIELNPAYVHAYYNRANLYRELRQYEESIADYNKVIELNPQHRFVYDNRGDAYAAIGNDELAGNDYTKIMTQVPIIQPKRMSVAKSMFMPSTPLDFLTRGE